MTDYLQMKMKGAWKTMNEQLLQAIQSIAYITLTVIMPIITTYIVKELKVLIQKSKFESLSGATNQWIQDAADIVLDIVVMIQQTYVDSLKKRGEFTPESAKEAKNKAVQMAMDMISEQSKDAIIGTYTSLEQWLDTQIESAVYSLKEGAK